MAYIDTEILKRNIRKNLMPNVDVDGTVTVECAERYFLNLIDKTSTADVEEVRHGEWIMNKPSAKMMKEFHDMGIGKAMALNSIYWTCSCCGTWGTPRYKYCPHCGAKMDGRRDT